MRRTVTAVGVLSCIAVLARADGGFFPDMAGAVGDAHTTQQHAVLCFDGSTETLILRTAYEGDGGRFAWVVPTASLVTRGNAATADPGILDDLDLATAPRQWSVWGRGVLGCGGGGAPQQQVQPQQQSAVAVFDSFAVDDYRITTLGAQESQALVQWLNARGYGFDKSAEDVLAGYIAQGWFFAAVEVEPSGKHQPTDRNDFGEPLPPGGGQQPTGADAMPPLVLRFAAARPVYPMRISAVSTEGQVEVLLYVLARHRMATEAYACEEVAATPAKRDEVFADHYAGDFRQHLAALGQPAFLVEFAGWLPEHLRESLKQAVALGGGNWFLTRVRGLLGAADMTDDVYFTQAPADRAFSVDFDVTVAQSHPGLLSLPLAAAVLTGLRSSGARRRRIRRGLLAALLCALLVI